MRRIVSDAALDILFRAAGERHAWLPELVSDTLLRAIWELVRLGPGSGLCDPPRIVFVKSASAKADLAAALPEPYRPVLATAAAAAIVACPVRRDDDPASREAELREGALHAAYLMLASRALGLDCAPLWQFDARLVGAAFCRQGGMTAHFLCALGYAEARETAPGEPRQGFAEACTIL